MRSPLHALLWDAKDAGAVIALGLIVLLQIAGWLSLPNLNGMRPGFPFALGYARPVRSRNKVVILLGNATVGLANFGLGGYLLTAEA